MASGTGLIPQPQDAVSVFTDVGSNTTLIIPFRNPMDHAVLVDILLKGMRKYLNIHVHLYFYFTMIQCIDRKLKDPENYFEIFLLVDTVSSNTSK